MNGKQCMTKKVLLDDMTFLKQETQNPSNAKAYFRIWGSD